MRAICHPAHMTRLRLLSLFTRKIFPVFIGLSLFLPLVIMTPAGAQTVPDPTTANWLVFPKCANSSTYNGKPLTITTYHGLNKQKILYVMPLKGQIVNGLLCIEVTTNFIGVLNQKDVRIQPGKMLVNPKAVPPAFQEAVLQIQPTKTGYTLNIRQDKNLLVTNVPRPAVVPPPITGIQKPPTGPVVGPGTGGGQTPGADPGAGGTIASGSKSFKSPFKSTSMIKNRDPGCDAEGSTDQNGNLESKTRAILGMPQPNKSVRGETKAMVAESWTAPKSGTAHVSAVFRDVHCSCSAIGHGALLPVPEAAVTDVGSIYLEVRSNKGGQPKKTEQELLRWDPHRVNPQPMTMQDGQRVLQASIQVQQGEILTLTAAVNHYSRAKNMGGDGHGETKARIQEITVQMPDR